MSINERFEGDLQRRFDGALDGVHPSPDLYGRVESRMSRTRPSRLLIGIASAVLGVAVGVAAVTLLDSAPQRVQVDPAAPTASEQPSDEPTAAPAAEPTDPGAQSPAGSASPRVDGEPYDGPPIIAGAELGVIGVDVDDVLNVRAAPGADHEVIATLAPLAEGFTATGQGRSLDNAIWVEIDTGDATGWVNATYLAFTGPTDDVTSQVVEAHGNVPRVATMEALAEIVAEYRATEEPPSRIVISDGPRAGDVHEVTVDVIGTGDDAVRGERLVIFAVPDDDGASFTLKAVEATTLCGRGVADDGICA